MTHKFSTALSNFTTGASNPHVHDLVEKIIKSRQHPHRIADQRCEIQ